MSQEIKFKIRKYINKMQNYFYIQPITLNISPFETAEVNAIEWCVNHLYRGVESAACRCTLLNIQQVSRYYS